MKFSKTAVGALIAISAFSGFAGAQMVSRKPNTSDTSEWLSSYLVNKASLTTARDYEGNHAESKKYGDLYFSAIKSATGNSSKTDLVVNYNLTAKEPSTEEIASLQILQNQKIIEQNAQIIKLLEKISAKK